MGSGVYIIYLPDEDDSVDSVLMCNPSGMEIPHWLEGSVKWYSVDYHKEMYTVLTLTSRCTCGSMCVSTLVRTV